MHFDGDLMNPLIRPDIFIWNRDEGGKKPLGGR